MASANFHREQLNGNLKRFLCLYNALSKDYKVEILPRDCIRVECADIRGNSYGDNELLSKGEG